MDARVKPAHDVNERADALQLSNHGRALLGRLLRLLRESLGAAVILLLADACGFAAPAAQIVELGAAHLAASHNLDRVDHRRIERKYPLHALAVGDFPDCETLVEARARARDADAF